MFYDRKKIPSGIYYFWYEYLWKSGNGEINSYYIKMNQDMGWLLDRLILELVFLSVSIGVTIFLLLQVSIILVWVLLFLLIFWQIIGLLLNSQVLTHRKKRIELDNIGSRYLVKIIMAKIEILQSKKYIKKFKNFMICTNDKFFTTKKCLHLWFHFFLCEYLLS